MEEGGRHFQIKTAWLESEELRFHFALHLHLLLKPAFFNLHLLGAGLRKMHRSLKDVVNPPDHVTNNQWDDWVPQDRVREFTPENKELAAQLHTQMKALQKIPRSAVKKGGKTNGSDFSSTRGSEERHTSAAAPGGRGPRRNRDYDLEHVSIPQFTFFVFVFVVCCFHCIVFIVWALAPARGLFSLGPFFGNFAPASLSTPTTSKCQPRPYHPIAPLLRQIQ